MIDRITFKKTMQVSLKAGMFKKFKEIQFFLSEKEGRFLQNSETWNIVFQTFYDLFLDKKNLEIEKNVVAQKKEEPILAELPTTFSSKEFCEKFEGHKTAAFRRIKKLIKMGFIKKLGRGLYEIGKKE